MPFSDAKFAEISIATQIALESDTLNISERQFLEDIYPMLANQGARVRLKERDISRLEDVLSPFVPMPERPKDPFTRYPIEQKHQMLPQMGASVRPTSMALASLALVVGCYTTFLT